MAAGILPILLLSLFLTGCASLLERRYATAEPHSGKFWESEAAGTLRAENHQDIVNDLLLLIGQHRESATIRLYHFDDDFTVADTLENATMEIQNETPLGSYAVAYIVSSSQAQRGYYEIKLQIGYRKTAEELQAIVNATSPEAVYSLLLEAAEQGREELTVRIGYWDEDGQTQVEEAMARLREELGLEEDLPWPQVTYYPESGPVGMLEFQLVPTEEESPEDAPDTGETSESDVGNGAAEA